MQQLTFVKKGKLQWREVTKPRITNNLNAIVRPFAAAKCDLDNAFLFNNFGLKLRIGNYLKQIDPNYKKIFGNLLNGPFPFGHECVAEVLELGDGVQNFKEGDIVSVPFQISCGSCLNCKQGFTSSCFDVPPISMYGFGNHLAYGGAMSDFLSVPYADAMLVKIPTGHDPIHLASLSDNIPDAYRHLESLVENKEQTVLIIGGAAKSVGLYSVLLAKALGAQRVDYVDKNQDRLIIAEKSGADNIYDSFQQIKEKYDIVVDANSTEKGLAFAIQSVRNYGLVTSSGIYIQKTAVSLIEMYSKGITFNIGLTNARTYAEKVLELIEKGVINFKDVTTKLESWDNAIDAFLTDTTKVIVTRDRLLV